MTIVNEQAEVQMQRQILLGALVESPDGLLDEVLAAEKEVLAFYKGLEFKHDKEVAFIAISLASSSLVGNYEE
jgi:hypothetical protein